jgi:intein/homing endonuclease
MNIKILRQYQNGNVLCTLYENGTQVLEYDGEPEYEFPTSMDVHITNYCNMGCEFCLNGNTIITTNNGDIPIKDVNIGDMVLSYNITNKNLEIKKVYNVLKRQYKGKIIEIVTDNGIIEITPEHKVFTQNRGWINAINLNQNDILLDI